MKSGENMYLGLAVAPAAWYNTQKNKEQKYGKEGI